MPLKINGPIILVLVSCLACSVSGQNLRDKSDSLNAKELPIEQEESEDASSTSENDAGEGETPEPSIDTEPSTVSVTPSFSFREMITVSANTAIRRIGLYSISGKEIFVVHHPEEEEFSFSPRGLSEGMYLLRITTISAEHVRKIMVTR